jgi:hypothetical protein
MPRLFATRLRLRRWTLWRTSLGTVTRVPACLRPAADSLQKSLTVLCFFFPPQIRLRVVGTTVLYKDFHTDLMGKQMEWFKRHRMESVVRTMQRLASEPERRLPFSTDFFFSVCDHPVVAPSTIMGARSGFAVFSTHGSAVTVDLLYPDPLDLSERYSPADVVRTPWAERRPVALFRGACALAVLCTQTPRVWTFMPDVL